jgi:hypothetical protein
MRTTRCSTEEDGRKGTFTFKPGWTTRHLRRRSGPCRTIDGGDITE